MGIDLSENGRGYYDLREHIGHKIVVAGYGNDEDGDFANVALECETCNEVLVDFDQPFYDKNGKCYECGGDCSAFMEDEGDDQIYCENEQCENSRADWGGIGEPS